MSDTVARVDPLPWVRDDSLTGDRLDIGPWAAVVTDAVPMPRENRIAGRFVARGLLKHSTGRAISKDFGGNTRNQARLMAKRWSLGSIRMWGLALYDNAMQSPYRVFHLLPEERRKTVLEAIFTSLQHQDPAHYQLDITDVKEKERERRNSGREPPGGHTSQRRSPQRRHRASSAPSRRRRRRKRA